MMENRIEIPHKKPRKSKNNPEPEFTVEQKNDNYALSKVRVLVENAISGIKRYNILVHSFRNRKTGMDDEAIALAAGLWNFLAGFNTIGETTLLFEKLLRCTIKISKRIKMYRPRSGQAL